jgi:glycosyltransferase involved in cell wall biosynthesis
LGELRNISIGKSNGEYLCIWDDDDWYHNQRIEVQVKALRKTYKSACLLTNLIVFDSLPGTAYYSFARLWEGSMLCKRDVLDRGLQYYPLDKGEDTTLLARMLSEKLIYPVVEPNIYIYIYHGNNISGYEHFRTIMRKSQRLSESAGKLIKEIVENGFSNRDASDLLLQPSFLREIDYLHSNDLAS